MARKRVILANVPRLLREMLQRVMNKADNLEVLQETPNREELSSAIERLGPERVILCLPFDSPGGWIDTCMAQHPSVRFIFLALSPGSSSIKMRWQTSCEEDLTNVSLKDFIHILEKDLQHT